MDGFHWVLWTHYRVKGSTEFASSQLERLLCYSGWSLTREILVLSARKFSFGRKPQAVGLAAARTHQTLSRLLLSSKGLLTV